MASAQLQNECLCRQKRLCKATSLLRDGRSKVTMNVVSTPMTRISLIFIPERLNVYLRFGRSARSRVVDGQRRDVYLRPGTVCCRVWWQANAYGTTRWELSVLLTASPGDGVQRIAGVVPGAIVLLHVDRASAVRLTLQLLDVMDEQGIDPTTVAPSYWRTVHNRLAARVDPPPYTPEQHLAFLRRQELV